MRWRAHFAMSTVSRYKSLWKFTQTYGWNGMSASRVKKIQTFLLVTHSHPYPSICKAILMNSELFFSKVTKIMPCTLGLPKDFLLLSICWRKALRTGVDSCTRNDELVMYFCWELTEHIWWCINVKMSTLTTLSPVGLIYAGLTNTGISWPEVILLLLGSGSDSIRAVTFPGNALHFSVCCWWVSATWNG